MSLKISIIGLGYVGLPLAVEFGKKYSTVGYDINLDRIKELRKGVDSTLEVSKDELVKVIVTKNKSSRGLYCSNDKKDLKGSNFYIVTVPTPTDKNNRPVLKPLISASETISKVLKKGDYVIYESTVYPGVTEDECVPVLEKYSNLKLNKDFFVGYSPERINPGDKKHSLVNIKKVTSGSNKESSIYIDNVYKSILKAGTHLAPSIKVAEAAKVIENSQRDLNIAFVNELAKIFNLIEIDTKSVLEAAETKWNFLSFKPGLVGGHCIGVDPYYLAQKAQELGYHPEIILAGRRINDGMGKYVAGELVKMMLKKGLKVKDSNVLILGLTFKENCPDIRNTRVIDVYDELTDYNCFVDVYDPWVDSKTVKKEFSKDIFKKIKTNYYDGIILAVAHSEFLKINIRQYLNNDGILYDVKGALSESLIDARL